MKKLLMTLVFVCACVFLLKAQTETAKKAPTSFSWSKEALIELGCDAAQIKQIATIRKDAAVKNKALKADSSIAEADKKAAARKISKERTESLMAVLNAEQKEKVTAINKKLKEEAKATKAK